MEYQHIIHPIEPVYDENSKILVLGSLPSVKSREQNFFYGHPQNRFWKVLAAVFEDELPVSIEEKKIFLKKHNIAVWDTIYSCDIIGSADSTIKNVIPTNIQKILRSTKVEKIFCNGKTSAKYYAKYQEISTGKKAVTLPSTSPANAMWSMEKLVAEWKKYLI